METGSGDSLVNKARKQVEGTLRGPVSCMCCGGTEWISARDLAGIWGTTWSNDPDADPAGNEAPSLVMLVALMLVCVNCGFVRWHHVEAG